MTRVRRIGLLVSVVGLLLSPALVGTANDAGAAHAPDAPVAAPDDRANIVLILTDDQAVSDLAYMPRTLKLMGKAGLGFSNFISPNPNCCPARATIMTGQYSQNNGVRNNEGPRGGFHVFDSSRTISTMLHDAGYHTGFVGKYLNGYFNSPPTQPGWDSFDAIYQGLYRYYDFISTNNGTPRTTLGVHSNDYIAAETRDLIEGFGADDRPFFIWASYVGPHSVCTKSHEINCYGAPIPALRHRLLYSHVVAPDLRKPSFNENVDDKAREVRSLKRVDPVRMQRIFRERVRTLASVDEGVADTLRALRETGELSNTLVLFASDNGYLLGEHRYEGKVLPYRESVEVPLLMRGPGIPHGRVRHQLTTLADLAPTFAQVAHAQPNLKYDGESLLPYAVFNSRQPDPTKLIQAARQGDKWTYRGVMTRRYTYARWTDGSFELFDHRVDPYELDNKHTNPRYNAVEAALRRRLDKLRSCAGANCRRSFPPLPQPTTP